MNRRERALLQYLKNLEILAKDMPPYDPRLIKSPKNIYFHEDYECSGGDLPRRNPEAADDAAEEEDKQL